MFKLWIFFLSFKPCDDPISAIVFRQNLRQLTPQPLILAYKFPILEEYFVNLRLFMPYPEQRVRFENICFKVMLFHVGNLGTIIGAKLCNARFRGWILAMLIELPLFQKVSAQSFFSCSQYTNPSTKHGYWSGLQIMLYFWETLLQPAACRLNFFEGSLWGIFKKS